MPLFRFPAKNGKAVMRHYADSSAQRHDVGANPLNPPQFSKTKITAWFYGLPLLLRKKSRRRSRKNNYRCRSVIFTSLDYQLFSVKRSSLRSERCRSKPLLERIGELRTSFLSFTFYMRLRRASERANILRTFAESGSAFKVRRSGSSEKSPVVAISPFS